MIIFDDKKEIKFVIFFYILKWINIILIFQSIEYQLYSNFVQNGFHMTNMIINFVGMIFNIFIALFNINY